MLAHLIDGAVYTSDIAWTKPAPEAFAAAMEAVGVADPARCVFVGDRLFDENTIHRPFGEKLCHEFISFVLQRMRRASPPLAGTIHNSLSGRISNPFRALTNTIHLPFGETFGKLLLIPLSDAPFTGSATPPRPSLNGMRYKL